MPVVPVKFATQSYESRSLPAAAQRLVNMYAEPLPEGANGQVALMPTPGLKPWATVGDGPIRGMHVMGTMYVVSGNELYTVDSGGNSVLVGTITGTGSVRMADNGTHVAVVADVEAYAVDSSSITTLSEGNFNGVDVQDGYGIFTRQGTNEFFITALDDMTTIDPLDFSTADVQADANAGVISDHRDVWILKERTIEIWSNVGSADFPFQRTPAGFIERGCAASGSIANNEHRVIWLGDDLAVYASQGYQPQRISTPAIDELIAGVVSPESAEAFTYQQGGHSFYAINFPTLSLAFDFTTGRWHERSTFGLDRWAAEHMVSFADKVLVGDYRDGSIYELDPETYTDDADAGQQRLITSDVLDGGGPRMFMDEMILNAETGIGTDDGSANTEPSASLECSDDGGRTWSTPRLASMGVVGAYNTRPTWTRLGSFYRRIMRVSMRDPNKFVVMGATARLSGGL